MSGVFRFVDFELRVPQRQLLHRGHPLQTGGRALDLLILLVEQRHRTVSKGELIDHCWPDQAVEPNNLAVQVWALRRLLGPQAIATVPGRGYRFVADVQDSAAPGPQQDPPAVGPGGPAPQQDLAAQAPVPGLPPGVPPAPLLLAPMFGREADLHRLLGLLQQHLDFASPVLGD